MLLDPASPLQPLKLLTCEGLPAAWPRLDAFEGEEMQRLLVPLEREGGIISVGKARQVMPGSARRGVGGSTGKLRRRAATHTLVTCDRAIQRPGTPPRPQRKKQKTS